MGSRLMWATDRTVHRVLAAILVILSTVAGTAIVLGLLGVVP